MKVIVKFSEVNSMLFVTFDEYKFVVPYNIETFTQYYAAGELRDAYYKLDPPRGTKEYANLQEIECDITNFEGEHFAEFYENPDLALDYHDMVYNINRDMR